MKFNKGIQMICDQMEYFKLKGELSEKLDDIERGHVESCNICLKTYTREIRDNQQIKMFIRKLTSRELDLENNF